MCLILFYGKGTGCFGIYKSGTDGEVGIEYDEMGKELYEIIFLQDKEGSCTVWETIEIGNLNDKRVLEHFDYKRV